MPQSRTDLWLAAERDAVAAVKGTDLSEEIRYDDVKVVRTEATDAIITVPTTLALKLIIFENPKSILSLSISDTLSWLEEMLSSKEKS